MLIWNIFRNATDTIHESVFYVHVDCLTILRSASNMKYMILFEEKVFLSLSFGRDLRRRRRRDILKQFFSSDLHLQIQPNFQGVQLLFVQT